VSRAVVTNNSILRAGARCQRETDKERERERERERTASPSMRLLSLPFRLSVRRWPASRSAGRETVGIPECLDYVQPGYRTSPSRFPHPTPPPAFHFRTFQHRPHVEGVALALCTQETGAVVKSAVPPRVESRSSSRVKKLFPFPPLFDVLSEGVSWIWVTRAPD